MTALTPLGTVRGVDLFGDARGGIEAHRDGVLIGNAFPQNLRHPDGRWYGKRRGVTAVLFDSRHLALAYLLGGCPECQCDPLLCAAYGNGAYCALVNCGVCLNGCPDGECDVTEETP